ncbi:geranylgeranyl pyrophosphate synthase [Subtercola boreus]|uniref:Geranylgeranyl pyrophosphate synthase n=1 Tax=Subtercola boreus TaxID=120213 RepID=A0A3E0VL35_9MICO|nr:polyprenyl synthetase family protein [Subtercola boreus]RFA10672.1 geranylgeranyl pyrophosphate synthase [Subtercola boreus]
MVDPQDLVVASSRRQKHVDDVLDRFFSLAKNRAAAIGPRYVTLWQTLERNTSGGKRFRPGMVMGAYESLGGTDSEAAAHIGAAFELLHTALIVHDDVIDRDFIRRGGVNVSGVYRDFAQTAGIPVPAAEHRGLSVAVIAGDLALSNAFRMIDKAGVGDEMRRRLHDIFDEALFASAAGELFDVDFSQLKSMPTVDEVVDMERLKTAVYSFESPCEAGAVLAGASDEAVRALASFGRNIGIAYQIVDDVLGVFGDEAATGKTTIGDLREGKRTVLIAYASGCPEWLEISQWLGLPDLTREQAGVVRRSLEACGARQYAEDLAREFADRAIEELASDALPDATRDEFQPVIDAVLRRVR